MEKFFTKEYTIGPGDVDRYLKLKPSRLLLYIQQISGLHSDALGYTYEGMAEQGIFWAVIRHRVEVTRMPLEKETVRLETWPMPTTRVAYPRCTVGYDAQGQELFRSICLWVLMDLNKRSMLLPKKSPVHIDGILRGMEPEAPGSLLSKPLSQQDIRRVLYSDLDRNGHMNNSRYLDWTVDLLPSDFHRTHSLREMVMCYSNEALEQQQLELNWELTEEGRMQVDIHRPHEGEDYDRIFAARLQYE